MNIKNLSAQFYAGKNLAAYWAHLRPDENICDEQEEGWKKKAAFLDGISTQNNIAITLWNAYTNRFVFMSDKWQVYGGYTPEQFTSANGISFSLLNIHPNFLESALLMNEKGVEFFLAHPQIPVNKVFINVSVYYRKKSGQYFQMLQQSVIVETDKKGQPLLVLSYVSDISHIKRPDCADMVITSPAGTEMYNYNFTDKTLEAVKPPTEHEKNILHLLARGFDSKKIAQMLQLSPNTIDTHRRNLIKKTNCIDTTGVVTYAKLTGII